MTKNRILVTLIMLLILAWAGYNIKNTFFSNKNTQNSFTKEVQKVYKTAIRQYKKDTINGEKNIVYANKIEYDDISNAKGLNIRGNSGIGYLIKFNSNGDITYLKVIGNKNEMELGDINSDSNLVLYENIVDSAITQRNKDTTVSFDEVENEIYSNVETQGYLIENNQDGYFVTIYLGKVSGEGNLSVTDITNNNGKYVINLSSTYDSNNDSEDSKTPSIKIKLSSVPSSIVINDSSKNITFNKIGNDSTNETKNTSNVINNNVENKETSEKELTQKEINEKENGEKATLETNKNNCSAGKYYDYKSNRCLTCPENTYSAAGSNTCISCPTNTCSPSGSKSKNSCRACSELLPDPNPPVME